MVRGQTTVKALLLSLDLLYLRMKLWDFCPSPLFQAFTPDVYLGHIH